MADFWLHVWNVRVLVTCAQILLPAWLKSRVQQLRPDDFQGERTIDSFLRDSQGKIESTTRGLRKSHIYFPGDQRTTKVELWDLEMLCYILGNFCQLDRPMMNDLNNLRDLRDTLALQRTDVAGNDAEDKVRQTRLKHVLVMITGHIKDGALGRGVGDVMAEMDEVIANKNDNGYTEHRRLLQAWYEQDQDPVDVSVQIKRDTSMILRLLENMDLSSFRITLPDTDITININGYTPAKEEKISNFLLRLIDEERNNIPSRDEKNLRAAIKKALHRFLNDRIVHTRTKCVQLTIRCSTFDSFLQLLTDGLEDKLTHLFKPVEVELRKLPGMENVQLYVELKTIDCIASIVAVVEQLFKRKITHSEVVPHKQGLSWHLGVGSPTMESAEQLNKSLQDGSRQKRLQQLTELIRQELGTPELNLEVADYSDGEKYGEGLASGGVGSGPIDLPKISGLRLSYYDIEYTHDGKINEPVNTAGYDDIDGSQSLQEPNFTKCFQYPDDFTPDLPFPSSSTSAYITKLPDINLEPIPSDSETTDISKVRDIRPDDSKHYITGLTVPHPGVLLATDHFNSVILKIDIATNKIISESTMIEKPWDITTIAGLDEAAVTVPNRQEIQVITTEDKLATLRSISVEGCCYGIASLGSNIVVSFCLPSKVEIMDLTGRVLHIINTDDRGDYLLRPSSYVTVSREKTSYRIYVSYYPWQSSITKITMEGQGTITSALINSPSWNRLSGLVCVRSKLFVSNFERDTVDVVNEDGNTVTSLIDWTHGVKLPQALCYYEPDDTLYVSSFRDEEPILDLKLSYKK